MQPPSALMVIHRYPCRLLDHRSHAILSEVHRDAFHDVEFWLGGQTRAERVGIFWELALKLQSDHGWVRKRRALPAKHQTSTYR